MNAPFCSVAVVTGPLFGSPWIALPVILVGISAFIGAVAILGRWLAATHPSPTGVGRKTTPQTSGDAKPSERTAPAPEVLAIIAAAVRVTFGAGARIAQVVPLKAAPPSVEVLMQQWSMEGRRQIYSSHQIR